VAPAKLLFIPGSGGDPAFWHPAGARLAGAKTYFGWPGATDRPHDPGVHGFDGLARRAADALDAPTAVIAQSMGGIVAVRLALGHSARITHLVLTATSGGVDVARFGGADWRTDYRRNHPRAAAWITDERPDHTEAIRRIAIPTLLIWGDADPISPLAVGRHLASLLPNARLEIVRGGDHMVARDRPEPVAALIRDHLGLPADA
jgi:pimeloyl-ACP methyl ester carboxylesterase